MRQVFLAFSVLLISYSCFAQEFPDNPMYLKLWADSPFPLKSEINFPEGCVHCVVQDGNKDPDYKFMHETAIGFYRDELVYGWYNNIEKELVGKTVQRARRSFDFGATWSEPEIVMDRDSDKGRMYVGLQFFSLDDTLYLLSNLESAAERPVHCLLAKYNYQTRNWIDVGAIADRFLSMQAPVINDNGDFVVSGSHAVEPGQTFASTPAVFISHGSEIEKPWQIARLDTNDKVNVFAETGIIVDGKNALAVTRRDDSPFPNFYESVDFGETWRSIKNETFPTAHSKIVAGIFSDGIRFVAFNYPTFKRTDDGRIDLSTIDSSSRDSLAIAIARPGEDAFSHVYMISDPSTPNRLAASHYPCVAEHEGWVYVSYTGVFVDKPLRVGALTKFPLKSLEE
ncbi:MAG: exo-alpha-sialidase [Thermoguttaceae bacterium]|nr:exo-alpha-sialidase [Thermoguttaceae bacterium]